MGKYKIIMIGYETNKGKCFCGDALDLLDEVEDNSIDLVITSPPFALQRKKAYGNEEQEDYVEWLCQFGEKVYKKIKENGSFVIDIGGAYEKGQPSYSLYQFKVLIKFCDEIGFKLAQPFYWHNPSALPAPIEWVNKRKIRAKTSVNTVWWLCKDPYCKADIRNVLTPYSKRMEQLFENPDHFVKNEGTIRPSGHVLGKSTWTKNNGGAIPPNLLSLPNTESNTSYQRICKNLGIKSHPARFPSTLPSFFIKMLTEEGDTVLDIFGGSNTTGFAAEQLNRNWITFELLKEYVAASSFRFTDNTETAKMNYDSIMDGKFIRI